jgi:ethanolamine ammonia-lyase small subunit
VSGAANDPWAKLRMATLARISIGRAGDGLPTCALLKFQHDHARARDAVYRPADFASIARQLAPHRAVRLESRAGDRATYLRRPDLGRALSDRSRNLLPTLAGGPCDLVFVIADGLSAGALTPHAASIVRLCQKALHDWAIAPILLVDQARVAIGDEIAELLGARMCAVLIGERPGLSVAESLGIYVTWSPRMGTQDAARNCVSNIHANGLSAAAAAHIATWLLRQGRQRGLTGVGLKEEAGLPPPARALLSPPMETGHPMPIRQIPHDTA